MAAVSGYLHLQYSSKDIFTISLLQVASAWTAVAVSNYTLPRVSLISNTARSLRIFCLVFSLLSFTLLRFKSKVKFTVFQLLKLVFVVFGLAVVFHVIAILFGAPVYEQSEETFCWALFMSHLVSLPACSLLGIQLELVPRIFFSMWSEATPEAYFQCSILCTLIGAWLGAFPIPLDWDRPWQVWPIPCVIGAIVGYIIGLGAAVVMFAMNEKRFRPQ
ncbi:unnamed protein product [Porites lobata]|uniref:Phosphatidylinositol-glycan biosynthesis class F protein n=1 Tax=Porites lobata TaxID=104759 RepID=A0ABN8NVS4_9CNID|nr:unnamed protein product [Porites lobata]